MVDFRLNAYRYLLKYASTVSPTYNATLYCNKSCHSIRDVTVGLVVERGTLYQDELTTDKKPTVGYSIPDEILATCFQLCELV